MSLGPTKNFSPESPERVGQEDKTLDPKGMLDAGQLWGQAFVSSSWSLSPRCLCML